MHSFLDFKILTARYVRTYIHNWNDGQGFELKFTLGSEAEKNETKEITLKSDVTRISLFEVNSVLKLLLSAFTQTAQNIPLQLSNKCRRGP